MAGRGIVGMRSTKVVSKEELGTWLGGCDHGLRVEQRLGELG